MMNKEGNMDSKQLEKRKKVLLDLMNDKIYVPMKIYIIYADSLGLIKL